MLVYSPQELQKLANRMNRPAVSQRDTGEVTARAFELFDEGRSVREIVRELRLTVEAVRELHEKWGDTGGADVVISPNAKDALEKIVGPFKTVTDLVERLAFTDLVISPSAKSALEKIIGPFKTVTELVERVALLKAVGS